MAKLSWVIPALLTRQSSLPPICLVASSIKFSRLSVCDISNFNILIPSNFFFSSSNFSFLVPVARILAPASCNFLIIEFPIPPVAPVTIILFFF